jgi:hypothetical protein
LPNYLDVALSSIDVDQTRATLARYREAPVFFISGVSLRPIYWAFFTLTVLAMPEVRADLLASCPQRLNIMGKRGVLQDARMYIGPPEKKHEIPRPRHHTDWDLSSERKRAEVSKEGLFLQCRYHGLVANVTFPVPRAADMCTVRPNDKKEVVVRCESAPGETVPAQPARG